jgi:hypothetical protein
MLLCTITDGQSSCCCDSELLLYKLHYTTTSSDLAVLGALYNSGPLGLDLKGCVCVGGGGTAPSNLTTLTLCQGAWLQRVPGPVEEFYGW